MPDDRDRDRKLADGSPGGITSRKRTDNDVTPPLGTTPPRKRSQVFQSQDARDFAGLEARAEREGRAPAAIHDPEDLTGQYEGEELREMRRTRRTTGERVEHLEDKLDDHAAIVSDLRADVGEIKGKLEVLPKLVSLVQGIHDRDHVTFTAQVEVDTAKQTAEIEKEKEIAVEQERARIRNELDVKRAKRERTTRIMTKILGAMGAVVAGWIVSEALRALGWL